ncbi:MAG: hypothetical protein IJR87_13080 [Bacteroidaceae bacterium]|nr:hypothetical protein [Bacteroidaceae bacterium]
MKQKLYSLMIALLVGLAAVAQPKADILDVVFNEDGTATDISVLQNEIIPVGMPYVVKSLKYGINEACFRNNFWGQGPKAFFRVDYEENDKVREAMTGSHSFEALIRPLSDPSQYDVTSKYFSNQQTGGGALSISGSKQNFSLFYADFIGDANKNVYSGVTVEPGKYYHVVGTWDKEEGLMSIYVDGKLCATLDADGAYQEPKEGSMWFCIGADPSTKGNATNAFTGDIAIARVYGSVLTAEDVEGLYSAVQKMDTGADEHADEQEYDPYFSMPNGTINSMTCAELEEPYSYELVTTGADPYIYWSPLQKAIGEEETVLTFEYKCAMGAAGSEFFLSPIAAGREFFFDLPAAEDWTTFYLDMANPIAANGWGAFGDFLRLDLGADAGITMDIRNIHFITKSEYLSIVGSDIGLQQDADGYYLVSTAEDLFELANIVNKGIKTDPKVRQTEDIDLGGAEWSAIGNGPCYNKTDNEAGVVNGGFEGLYDGQGHTVSNFAINESSEAAGLFGIVTGTVRNLGISGASFNATKDCRAGALAGTVTASGRSAGLIENCYAISSSILTTERVCGGLVGAICGGMVRNCYTFDITLSGYGDRFGGIAGDTKNDNGWAGTVENCYTDFGRITSSQAGTTTGGAAGVSAERFANGEIAYKLNGSKTTLESVWRQNLEEDKTPVLNATHGFVLQGGDTFFSIAEDGFEVERDEICEKEYTYSDEVICQKSLVDGYLAVLDNLSEASTFAEFFTLYNETMNAKKQLMESAQCYAAYQAKIDEVKAYLEANPSVTGTNREILDAYLDTDIEPNDMYPNGSYSYIMDVRELDNEGITAETDFVQRMFDWAVAGGYTEGSDITSLIMNPAFAEGTKNWTIENGTMSVTNVPDADTKYVAYSSGKTCLTQTITDLQPGVYEIRVNACYRAAGANVNLNQAVFFFANNNKVYLPTRYEGMLSTEAANKDRYEPIYDENNEIVGYIPNSTEASAFAFGEGAYENVIVAEVGEDGKLTLGINTLGCDSSNDTWVGAFRMKYCGTADSETSNAAYDATLEGQLARLRTLAYDYVIDSYNYAAAPSYSSALKNEVMETVESGVTADNKTAQIAALGDLMQRVYDCKQAYVSMMTKAEVVGTLYENMYETGMLTDEEVKLMTSVYVTISDAYIDGAYTYEEALAVNPFDGLSFVPQIVDNKVTISDLKEFIVFAALVNSGFYNNVDAVLTADIDLEGCGWTAIGFGPCYNKTAGPDGVTNPGFAGVFDGQGHTISNFTINETGDGHAVGLFGIVTGTVRNLGVDGASFNATMDCRVGGIAGTVTASATSTGLVENCFVKNSSILTTERVCGGVVGAVCGGLVRNCYSFNNMLSGYGDRFGGIAGDTNNDSGWAGTVDNCYTNYQRVTSSQAGTTTNCQANVGAARFKTGEIAYLLNGGATEGEGVVWYQTLPDDELPVMDNTHFIVRLLENGVYANFDAVNAELLALAQEAQGLVDMSMLDGHKPLITDGNQLSDNCLWQAGFEIQNIIDGDLMTYFHSRTDIALGTEYFQVNLTTPINQFDMEYTGRSDGAPEKMWHDTPDQIRIEGTNTPGDESSWKELTTVQYEIPNENGAHFETSEPVQLGDAYQYLRFYILHATSNNNYWNIAEFQMYSVGDGRLYDLNEAVKAAVDALSPVVSAKYDLARAGQGTQADIDELTALMDALREAAGFIKVHKGTQDDPYEIATAEDFVKLHNMMHTGETTYVKLVADIDMSEAGNWMPLNDATNTANGKSWMNWLDFDGQGHVVSNLSCSGYEYCSVFGVFCGAVRNVGFENVNIYAENTGGGVIGGYMGHTNYADANGVKYTSTLENVWVTGKLNVASSYCGGLIGNIGGPSIIKNCYTNLEITSAVNYVGGIVGRIRDELTMENVYAAGTQSKGGGIVGGGQNASTPASTYTNCVVWNNATEFGATAEGDVVSGTRYYDGTNFAELQQYVVSWGDPWICDMAEGSYPTFNKEKLTDIQQIAIEQNVRTEKPMATGIYTLDGRLVRANAADVKSLSKGLYIIAGRKVVVK